MIKTDNCKVDSLYLCWLYLSRFRSKVKFFGLVEVFNDVLDNVI